MAARNKSEFCYFTKWRHFHPQLLVKIHREFLMILIEFFGAQRASLSHKRVLLSFLLYLQWMRNRIRVRLITGIYVIGVDFLWTFIRRSSTILSIISKKKWRLTKIRATYNPWSIPSILKCCTVWPLEVRI